MVIGHSLNAQTMDFKSEDCVKGKIRIKLRESLGKQGNSFQAFSGDVDGSDIGVESIDLVSKNVGIKRIRRVFPFSEKNESKHREYGLHLWIELDFDENEDPLKVVEQYIGLSDLEVVKPVLKKISIDSDKEGVPYKVEVLSKSSAKQVTSTSSSAEYESFFDDPLLEKQWHYENDGTIGDMFLDIDLFEAWEQTTGDSNIIVAVVDQGIDVFHEDLFDNIWKNEAEINGVEGVDDDGNGYIDDFYGYNFVMDGAIAAGDHGTHVAGTVGAVSNNGLGVAGVAGGNGTGNGVKLISCQVFDSRVGGGRNFAEAIVYGADNGAVISQNSWGYNTENYYEPEILDAIRYFIAEAGQYEGSPMKGGILFFAAGNTGTEQNHYPGAFDEVVAVTSMSADGLPAPYTSFGDWTDIGALGGDMFNFGDEGGIMSTLPGDQYGFMEGSSMACPHVSGVAALVISKFGGNDFKAEDLRRIILNSSNRFIFQHNNKYGKGYLNAANALADDNRIPPNAIDDLRTADISHDEIRLEWNVPVDEDNGEPRYFYLAISETEITDDNFENSGLFFIENELKAGEVFKINIGGLTKLKDYWFAVKSADRFENISEISNILKTQTSNLPKFMESTRLIDVSIDVATETIATVPIQLSNIGDGILYYNTTVTNEEYFYEVDQQQEVLSAQIEKKAEETNSDASLYEATQPLLKSIENLESASILNNGDDHWGYDKTEYVAGIGYHNDNLPPNTQLGSGNNNIGLITALRFDVPYDISFNLTHIETVLYPEINDKPIIIEIKKGSKDVQEAETVYVQEYYPDTTNVLKYYRIPLHRPQRFTDNEIFWVVMHYPKEMSYPAVLQFGEAGFGYHLMSRNNGNSFQDTYFYLRRSVVPMFYALSSGKDGAYVFLDPNSGEIHKGETKTANVVIDATNLSEGKHLASLGIITNDVHKPVINIEVKVDVKGQKAEIDTDKTYDYRAYLDEDNELSLDIKNIGLADLEIYDVSSTTAGVIKNFDETIVVGVEYKASIPFKFTPTNTGLIQSNLILSTNIGDINLDCEFKVVEAPKLQIDPINEIDVVYGETASVNLILHNTGASTALEYDLKHYDAINLVKKPPVKLEYKILTSSDVNGPEDNQWDDISSIATSTHSYFDITNYKYDLDFKFSFFDGLMENAFANNRGQVYFYRDGLLANNPESEFYGTSKGLLVPLWVKDNALRIKEVLYYSFGDRSVFTVEANITSGYSTGFKPIADFTYQVVLFKSGAIEFRYKDVNQLKPEWLYTIAIQGLIEEDLILYKDFEDTSNLLYDGKVIRFEPVTDISTIVSVSSVSGTIKAGESVDVNFEINPKAYSITEGTYFNEVLIKTNTTNKNEFYPLTINVDGTSEYSVVDTIDFGKVNMGSSIYELVRTYNTGSANGFINTINFDDSQFSVEGSLPIELNASTNLPLKVTYEPTSVSVVETKMYVGFDDGTQGVVVLKGICVEDAEYILDIQPEIVIDIIGGETATVPLSIQNIDKGVDLNYTFKNNWLSWIGIDNNVKDETNFENPLGSEYGYWWDVSDDEKPFYKWEDITSDSEKLIIEQDNQKLIVLPFKFPFYGELYDTIWVSKNGYVTVIEPESDHFDGFFEKEDGLQGMMAPFWSILNDPDNVNGVKLKAEDNRVIIQWDNFVPTNDAGIVSFQLEIIKDGSIYFHYKDVESWQSVLNYGLESPDETEVLETERSLIVRYSIFSDKSSIAFIPPHRNTLLSGEKEDLELLLSAERIYKSGVYNDTIEVYSNSKAKLLQKIPVQLNVTGTPMLKAPLSLNWENVIFKDNLMLTRKFTLVNEGFESLSINKIVYNQLEDLILYDETGEKLVITSSGVLMNSIDINPWGSYTIEVEIPVSNKTDVEGEISFIGDFSTVNVPVTANFVDSPSFSWTATSQEYSLDNTQVEEYLFSITNNSETPLEYTLTPAAIPTGNPDELPGNVEGELNYTTDPPLIVRSLALDEKEAADGVFTPFIEGIDLAFSNRFVAPEDGFFLTHVKAYNYLDAIGEVIKVIITVGGDDPQSGEIILEQKFVVNEKIDEEWMYFALNQPISINAGDVFYVTITHPLSHKYMGYENTNDVSVLENSFVGIYQAEGEYLWFENKDQGQVYVWKIRPLTAAGEDQWIQLDNYGGKLDSGESISVVANIDASKAGKGKHNAKIIASSNDINSSSNQVDIQLNVNGGAEFKYYPNIYEDTLRIKETEKLLLNYLFVDPEGDKMEISIENISDVIDVELEQIGETTAQVEVNTDYESEGIYAYPVNVIDEVGSISKDTIVIKVLDKNRPPILNKEFESITLNLADPSGLTIDPYDLFTDPDGDDLQFFTGNYNRDIVDMALGSAYIHLSPLSLGTAVVLFAADDGKEDGFVIYSVYVQVIDDPDSVNASPDGNGGQQKAMLGEDQNFMIYPNVVENGSCNVIYKIPNKANVIIEVYDALGHRVNMIQEVKYKEGEYRKFLNVERYGSGIYYCRLIVSGEVVGTEKIIIR